MYAIRSYYVQPAAALLRSRAVRHRGPRPPHLDRGPGARDDLVKATDIAKSMVKAYGMSDALGKVSFDRNQHPLFLQSGQAAVMAVQPFDAEDQVVAHGQAANVVPAPR